VKGEVGTGYVETVPEIAARILAALSGPAITNTSAMTALRSGRRPAFTSTTERI
jgi:hypothetical protein